MYNCSVVCIGQNLIRLKPASCDICRLLPNRHNRVHPIRLKESDRIRVMKNFCHFGGCCLAKLMYAVLVIEIIFHIVAPFSEKIVVNLVLNDHVKSVLKQLIRVN